MLFIALTVISIGALVFRLTSFRYISQARQAVSPRRGSGLADYFSWVIRRTREAATPAGLQRMKSAVEGRIFSRYPGWRKWIIIAMAASFLFLSAGGFFFALFIPRGMFGVFLLLHVMTGGLFALAFAAVIFLRARDYRLDSSDSGPERCDFCFLLRNVPLSWLIKGLFWVFTISGLSLILTALASMLRWFDFSLQIPLLEVHRYSALAAVLAAAAYLHFAVIPSRK
jgi:hypothetical protein